MNKLKKIKEFGEHFVRYIRINLSEHNLDKTNLVIDMLNRVFTAKHMYLYFIRLTTLHYT